MGERPSASIIIPTYMRRKHLTNLLSSLTRQTGSLAFEVIVVQDGPIEDLSSLEIEFSDINVKVFSLPEKRGRASARNLGIAHSHGEILIFLDDDMTVNEGFVQAHLSAHKDNRTVAIGNVVAPPEYATHPLARYIERQGAKKLKRLEDLPPKCFRTGNASVGRALVEEAGLFDESLKHYGEDMDMAVKLFNCGARFVFVQHAISYHHHPPELEDMIEKMREYGYYTVPVLASRHPYLRKTLKIDLADPLKFVRESPILTLRKIALRFALLPIFYRVSLMLARCTFLGRLLFPIYDHIRAYNYIKEYWRATGN